MKTYLVAILLAASAVSSIGISAEAITEVSPTTIATPREGKWLKRHERINQHAANNQWNLVFLGDSITDGWHSKGSKIWKSFYGKRQAGNLGIGGDQTQHVIYRIENGNLAGQSPKLAVIMIGTNNLGRNRFNTTDTIAGVKAVVQKLHKATPDTQVLLLGIFPRGEASDDAFRAKIDVVNIALSDFADWDNVHFLDIGHVFLEPDGSISKKIMPDFLHLSAEGYRRWAQAIEPKIAELLGESTGHSKRLFDGKTLKGWKDDKGNTPPKGWGVVNGTLAVTSWGEDALTDEQYGDFDFQAEWQLPRKGNGGIFYRVADYRYIRLGPEYQLADDLTRGYQSTADNSTGASIDLFGPCASKPVREHSRWNHSRIVVVGDQVEHWLNGQRILTYAFQSDDWNARVKESKFSRLHPYFGQPQRGNIKLQNHIGSRVRYRDIIVREL